MAISTYFIWIFIIYSVSLVQTEDHPLPNVFIQNANNNYSFTEWRRDNRTIDWRKSEERLRFTVELFIFIMRLHDDVSDVDVHVRRTDCKTGDSRTIGKFVSDVNECSYHGSSCITIHFIILKLDGLPNRQKECEDWLTTIHECYKQGQKRLALGPTLTEDFKVHLGAVDGGEFTGYLLPTVLPGVLLVITLILVYLKMKVTGKSTDSIKDPQNFAGEDEEGQNRLILVLTSADRIRHSKDLSIPNLAGDDESDDDDDDDDKGQDRLVVGLAPTEGRCTWSLDFPPDLAGDDDGDEGQNRLVAGLTPAGQSWNSRNVSTPNLAFGRPAVPGNPPIPALPPSP